LISYFFTNGVVFELHASHGPAHTKKLLVSMFSVLKMLSSMDEKLQLTLYSLAEEKGLHNLLLSESILSRTTFSLCLTLLLRLLTETRFITVITDFAGITLIDKARNFLEIGEDGK
jgi:hypothetical protein